MISCEVNDMLVDIVVSTIRIGHAKHTCALLLYDIALTLMPFDFISVHNKGKGLRQCEEMAGLTEQWDRHPAHWRWSICVCRHV